MGRKGEILILLDGLHRIPCLFYSVPYHLDFPIIIWKFPAAGDIIKISHLGYILIYRVEDIDEIRLIHYLITPINILNHEILFLFQELLYFRMFPSVIMIDNKCISQ